MPVSVAMLRHHVKNCLKVFFVSVLYVQLVPCATFGCFLIPKGNDTKQRGKNGDDCRNPNLGIVEHR